MITTYNQAKRMKELGYREEVLKFYNEGHTLCEESEIVEGGKEYETMLDASDFIIDQNKYKYRFSAPTISEALQWIRENKEIMCAVELIHHETYGGDVVYEKFYQGVFLNDEDYYSITSEYFTDYPEAESALLDLVLTYLKQKR